MMELFHTEDCGLSLICRCCRGPVCERRLTRADRMRDERGLWSHEYRDRRHRSPIRHGKRRLRWLLGCLSSLLNLVVSRVLPIQKDGEA
jgi:hypothetical protein